MGLGRNSEKSVKQKVVNIFGGLFIGLLIWILSPTFTGAVDPWDAINNAKYYPIVLIL